MYDCTIGSQDHIDSSRLISKVGLNFKSTVLAKLFSCYLRYFFVCRLPTYSYTDNILLSVDYYNFYLLCVNLKGIFFFVVFMLRK